MSPEQDKQDERIVLRGVRVHNLKNIDLDLPLDSLILITGVSGSGKSSLAFDTLYAEGQRRYLESLSSYARQFLERMDKPDADLIEGIPPAIAIQQKASTKNPRSTVATVTEIHDYLRVLFARVGTVHCLKCGRPVSRDTIDSAVDRLFALPAGTKALITFAWPPDKNPAALKKMGFFRVAQNGRVIPLDELKDPAAGPDLDILVDRLAIDPAERDRAADSLELGLRNGGGVVKVRIENGEEILFSDRLECKECRLVYEEPFPNLFSFNSPQGACPVCHGFGDLAVIDEDKVIPDRTKSLEEGAVEPWTKPKSRGLMREMIRQARRRGIPTDVPFKNLKPEWQRFVLDGEKGFYGVKGYFRWLQRKQYKVQNRVLLARYRKYAPCPACGKTRLNPRALSVRIGGLDIGRVAQMTVEEAHAFFTALALKPFEEKVAGRLRAEIVGRLRFLLEVGLDYLTLDRMTFTLSGGEAQRINLAAALGSSLVGALFVLDEPSVGLHARDNDRLTAILRSLKDIGNTVVVVEHDPDIIRAAEYAVDLGPGAGAAGGRVIFAGPMDRFLRDESSLTAHYLSGRRRIPVPSERRRPRGAVTVRGARKHNLKDIDVRIPLGVFSCLTGVSGSGKSTLLADILHRNWEKGEPEGCDRILGRSRVDKLVLVDQAPLSASLRSIPATYTKAMDDIRLLFSRTREARAQGMGPGMFSFNTPGGRCEECQGDGRKVVEMQFLSDVVLTCEACLGRRFKAEVLDIPYRGKNIHQVLELSVEEAVAFFADQPRIVKKLSPLRDVGLGYLRLGQPTTTLSGGELQRIKLAHHLIHEREKRILYLFDEPTVGLHPDDVAVLLRAFERLVGEGHSICVIEHNLDVIKCADWVIDLGPEGGERGGRVVAAGTPEEVAAAPESITGRYLKKHLKAAAA
ncbi:MAG: excinuclease ABC subunit UvrA [Candidatus Aminicenantes bacterium]|nr:excinuclease ABC subunit UvrA [Candidatus Aminicenantes bacterium]